MIGLLCPILYGNLFLSVNLLFLVLPDDVPPPDDLTSGVTGLAVFSPSHVMLILPIPPPVVGVVVGVGVVVLPLSICEIKLNISLLALEDDALVVVIYDTDFFKLPPPIPASL